METEITMVPAKKRVALARVELREAVYDGRAQDVDRLLAEADSNKNPDHLIHLAAKRGDLAIVQVGSELQ